MRIINYCRTGAKHGCIAITGGSRLEARIRIRLTPRAARDEIAGWQNDVLRVRVTAPPVKGAANAALERLLAKALNVPKSAVGVVSGAKAREKIVGIGGLSQDEAFALLRPSVEGLRDAGAA